MTDELKPDWTVSPLYALFEEMPGCDWADFATQAGLTRDEQIAIAVDGDISVAAAEKIASLLVDIPASFWRNMSQQYLSERKRLGKDVTND